jgi:hypothetical protein
MGSGRENGRRDKEEIKNEERRKTERACRK